MGEFLNVKTGGTYNNHCDVTAKKKSELDSTPFVFRNVFLLKTINPIPTSLCQQLFSTSEKCHTDLLTQSRHRPWRSILCAVRGVLRNCAIFATDIRIRKCARREKSYNAKPLGEMKWPHIQTEYIHIYNSYTHPITFGLAASLWYWLIGWCLFCTAPTINSSLRNNPKHISFPSNNADTSKTRERERERGGVQRKTLVIPELKRTGQTASLG